MSQSVSDWCALREHPWVKRAVGENDNDWDCLCGEQQYRVVSSKEEAEAFADEIERRLKGETEEEGET